MDSGLTFQMEFNFLLEGCDLLDTFLDDKIHFYYLLQVDLRHMCEVEGSNVVDLGIDLSEFYMSVEWDILEVPAVR